MINQKRIEELLKTAYFGKYLYVLPEVDSTNTFAREKAKSGAPEGSVIIADYQTDGRGTRGRSWESSPGENILMSVILRPQVSVNNVSCITLATALILIRSISSFLLSENIALPDIEVKWPNDILINGGKTAGVLTESSIVNRSVEYLIIGIGINVNQDPATLNTTGGYQAGSLSHIAGAQLEREKLIVQILSEFERHYISMERTRYCDVIPEWKKYWRMQGRKVKIATAIAREAVEIVDINRNGILVYKTETGELKELIAGTVLPE